MMLSSFCIFLSFYNVTYFVFLCSYVMLINELVILLHHAVYIYQVSSHCVLYLSVFINLFIFAGHEVVTSIPDLGR